MSGERVEPDRSTVAARTAAAMFAGAGAVVLATLAWAPSPADRGAFAAGAGLALAAAAVVVVLPWSEWPSSALLIMPVVAFAMLAASGAAAPSGIGAYASFYLLVFGWIGLNQPPRTSVLMAPVAVGSYLLAGGGVGAEHVIDLPVRVLCWVLMGETLAWCLAAQRRSRRQMKDLFVATRALVAAEHEAGAADTAAGVVQDLLDADTVEVLVADHPGSPQYVNRGQRSSPARLGSMVVDASIGDTATGRCVASGRPLFFPGLSETTTGISTRLAEARSARSALFVPLPGEGSYLGVIAVVWQRSRRRLPSGIMEVVSLMSVETGRALERTRSVARLAAQADTDELTGLANRRALERRGAGLVPGDAVVLIDLDRFKTVNDTLGHDGGDEVLRALARCLARAAEAAGTVARLGGDEFAWVIPASASATPATAVEELRAAWLATGPVTTFSSGLARHADGVGFPVTLKAADAALYEAKLNGRDRTVVADGEPAAPVTGVVSPSETVAAPI